MKNCRTCLNHLSDFECMNIDVPIFDEMDVLQAITELTSLQGSYNDVLPKYICRKCFKLLKATLEFKRLIIQCNNQLIRTYNSAHDQLKLDNSSDSKKHLEFMNIDDHTESIKLEGDIFPDVNWTYNKPGIEDMLHVSEPPRKICSTNRKSKKNVGHSGSGVTENETTVMSDNTIFKNAIQENVINSSTNNIDLLLQKNENMIGNSLSGTCNDSSEQSKKKYPEETPCPLCGAILKDKETYNFHMRTHNTENPPLKYFTCSICPKRYLKQKYLLIHTRSHTGEKPYHCVICDKHFSQFATFYVHKRRLHEKVVQGTCNYCGKVFVDKSELDVHIRLWHTGERPYLCEFCSAAFACNRTLQRHRKELHSEKKPCQKCGKMLGEYALKKHLVRHKVLEEGLKIHRKKFTCEYCRTVMNFTSRKRHLETQHGIVLLGRGNDCIKQPILECPE